MGVDGTNPIGCHGNSVSATSAEDTPEQDGSVLSLRKSLFDEFNHSGKILCDTVSWVLHYRNKYCVSGLNNNNISFSYTNEC